MGKAGERSFFYVSSSRNGAERHVRPELRGCDNQAINRATQTLRNVESAWVKDMNVLIENGNIRGYKVNLAITFVLEEGEQPA